MDVDCGDYSCASFLACVCVVFCRCCNLVVN